MLKFGFKHLTRHEIDVAKWNEAIKNAVNTRIYAYSWYLDVMTDRQWSALIFKDYDCVFPLLVKTRFYLKYVTHPYLCQQLGIFSKTSDQLDIYSNYVLDYLKVSYFKTDCSVNNNFIKNGDLTTKTNHILDLTKPYQEIKKSYNRNTKRNIVKALTEMVVIEETSEINTFLHFMKKNDNTKIVDSIEKNIHTLIETTFKLGRGLLIFAKDHSGLNAVAFFIIDENRIYFLLCSSDKSGKEKKAMYLIIDSVIKRFAGSNKILDFTGSNMANIARRNLGFGAIDETYFSLRLRWNPFLKPDKRSISGQ